METSVWSTITFGRNGNSANSEIAGWSAPEEHWTWSDGQFCALMIEAPRAPFGFFIEADWWPATKAPIITRQVVTVKINERVINTFSIDRSGHFAFLCPSQPDSSKHLIVGFHFATSFRPSDLKFSDDRRCLALAFRRLRVLVLKEPWKLAQCRSYVARVLYADTEGMKRQAELVAGVALEELLHGFEMLSGNCDMGLALREMQFEKLSLLRFGGATVRSAMDGLEHDFSGLGQKLSLSVADNPMREWMVRDGAGLLFHTGQSSLTTDKATVERGFPRHVEFLRRKFLEDLDEAKKIFVYADHRDLIVSRTIEDVLPLYLALRRRSRARMLWVCPSTNDPNAKGSVREILPGLALGQIDLTSPPVLVGGGITVSGWLTVLCNAWVLFHQSA